MTTTTAQLLNTLDSRLDWSGSWRKRGASTTNIGIRSAEGMCLTVLLSHHNKLIVYVAVSLWRKMLTMFVRQGILREPTAEEKALPIETYIPLTLPNLAFPRSICVSPNTMGMLGRLRQIEEILPESVVDSIKSSLPLRKNAKCFQTDPGAKQFWAMFWNWLIRCDQRDAIALIMEKWDVSIHEGWSEEDNMLAESLAQPPVLIAAAGNLAKLVCDVLLPRALRAENPKGETPEQIVGSTFVAAASGKAMDVVERLIKKGDRGEFPGIDEFPINAADQMGNTAAHHAATGNDVEMMRLLKKKGANLNLGVLSFQWRPLHKAVQQKHVEVCKAILEPAEVEEGEEQKESELDIFALDYNQGTALHVLAFHFPKGAEVVKMLLAYPDGDKLLWMRDDMGHTPRETAASCGFTEIEKLLEDAEAAVPEERRPQPEPELTPEEQQAEEERLEALLAQARADMQKMLGSMGIESGSMGLEGMGEGLGGEEEQNEGKEDEDE